MGSIGQKLRTEREKRGLSLGNVQSETRISQQNLLALEEENFNIFPNKVYARAFLRDYANFLGLDSGPLLEEYEVGWNPVQQEAPPQPLVDKTTDGAAAMLRTLAIVIILIIVGLAVARPAYQAISSLMQSKPTTPQSVSAPIVPPKPATIKPEPKPTPPAPPPSGVTLELQTIAASWIRITVDGKKAYEGIMPAGQHKTWYGEKGIAIRTGNAGGVRLKVDGRDIPPIGQMGRIGSARFAAATHPPTPTTTNSSPN